jgi:hypothetical protein
MAQLCYVQVVLPFECLDYSSMSELLWCYDKLLLAIVLLGWPVNPQSEHLDDVRYEA